MKLAASYKSLCLPSKIYFVLAIVGILLSVLMPDMFGGMPALFHIIHLIYAVFWTWVLNLICGAGYKWISWALVLAPFILILLIASIGMGGSRESDREVAMEIVTQM